MSSPSQLWSPWSRRLVPSALRGPDPELRGVEANAGDRAAAALGRMAGPLLDALRSDRSFLFRVGKMRRATTRLRDAELRDELRAVARGLRRHGFERERVARALAVLGRLARRPPKSREIAGCLALLEGGLVEMQAEEGSWATGYAACLAALADVPVHVVTLDEAAARRGVRVLTPLYEAAGLRGAFLSPGQDPTARRESLGADVIHAPSRELVFDYLRDQITMGTRSGELSLRMAGLRAGTGGPLRLRGLCYAIVASADAVLLDDAAAPLVISGPDDRSEEGDVVKAALELARSLEPGAHYAVTASGERLELTDRGCRRLEQESQGVGAFFSGAQRRSEWVCLALQALHLRHRDEHYRVGDGRVELLSPVDVGSRELLLLIEAKEGLEPSALRSMAARISHQSFFQRYHRIAGLTPTAGECAAELERSYGLRPRRLPSPGRPEARDARDTKICVLPDGKTRNRELAARIASLRAAGQPSLVVVRSTQLGEQLGRELEGAGICVHRLLASQAALDAEGSKAAGEAGAVTIATPRAARVALGELREGVAGARELHVLIAECLESRRVRRALTSRSGVGGPGNHETLVSLEDHLLRNYAPRLAPWLGARRGAAGSRPGRRWLSPWGAAATGLVLLAERRMARLQRKARSRLQARERQLASSLSFAGAAD